MRSLLFILLGTFSGMPAIAGLTWEQTTLHVEAGPLDDQIQAVFKFTNSGDTPVTITQTHASCGCTVPSLEKTTFAPGEAGEMRLVYTIAEGTVGRQEKTVTVLTDTIQNSTQLLTLTVNVPGLWEVQPRFVRWERDEAAAAKMIRIRSLHPELARPVTVSSNDPRFTAELQAVPDEAGVFVVAIKPTATAEPAMASIMVESNLPEGSKQRVVQLYGVVR